MVLEVMRIFRFLNIIRIFRNSIKYLYNPEIPFRYKLIPAIAFFYFIIPIDLLPELRILGIGLIDDFFVVYSLLYWFDSLCKKYIDKKEYIDTEYKIKDEEEEN